MNPFRPYFVAFLLLILSAQLLHKTGFIIYFSLNKAEIIKEKCVNKNAPVLKCDGKCHLKKYVQAEQKAPVSEENKTSEAPSLPDIDDIKNFHLYFSGNESISFSTLMSHLLIPNLSTTQNGFSYLSIKGNNFHSPVFHPPLV